MVKRTFVELKQRIEERCVDFDTLKPDSEIIQEELHILKLAMSPSEFEVLKHAITQYLTT